MNDTACFVDTGCWIGLLNQQDELHLRATQEYQRLMKAGRMFVTTTLVLTEVANALSQARFRNTIVQFYRRTQRSARVQIVFVDERLWQTGWDLYETRPDKEWSLTDCVSIALMQNLGLCDALTYDHHFVQAGFRAILRETPL